ncbi:hypothetical protein [Streptomyces sp. SID3343]|uniref:hypothetical protein n=1 Tax=Streptomyces sp. SID3343 TaxID=2690260 RepID=UPI00136C14B9|nr:hypothetical protein [Streptomyces sp. SID3343]MYW02407.1 hypothetical protein [Streptomyces sp. SID3343]
MSGAVTAASIGCGLAVVCAPLRGHGRVRVGLATVMAVGGLALLLRAVDPDLLGFGVMAFLGGLFLLIEMGSDALVAAVLWFGGAVVLAALMVWPDELGRWLVRDRPLVVTAGAIATAVALVRVRWSVRASADPSGGLGGV